MPDSGEPNTPTTTPAVPAPCRDRLRRFRNSPYLPATVLVFILAVAAGLFAGSYTYILANPTPHRIPVAVVDGDVPVPAAGQGVLDGMDRGLNGALHQLERCLINGESRAEQDPERQPSPVLHPDAVPAGHPSGLFQNPARLVRVVADRTRKIDVCRCFRGQCSGRGQELWSQYGIHQPPSTTTSRSPCGAAK